MSNTTDRIETILRHLPPQGVKKSDLARKAGVSLAAVDQALVTLTKRMPGLYETDNGRIMFDQKGARA